MQKMKKKAAHDLNLTIAKGLQQMLHDKQREKYTLTDIYDITKELNFKITEDEVLPVPTVDANI